MRSLNCHWTSSQLGARKIRALRCSRVSGAAFDRGLKEWVPERGATVDRSGPRMGVGWGVASMTTLPYAVMSVAPCRKWSVMVAIA